MPATAGLSEARAFAESVAGVLGRYDVALDWAPGECGDQPPPELARRLDELGWSSLAAEPELVACAGLGAVELGRGLAPVAEIDRLLGGSPLAGDLVRGHPAADFAVTLDHGSPVRRPVVRSERLASSEGLDVHRVLELGAPARIDASVWEAAFGAWLAAGVGYLAGVGQGALDLTVDYVSQRRAFGSTLAGLAPVQQMLADAATAVRGVLLLAGEAPGADALAHAGPAIAQACTACQQATGAIGYTLEYPLHRCTQRARALATWNDALLDALT